MCTRCTEIESLIKQAFTRIQPGSPEHKAITLLVEAHNLYNKALESVVNEREEQRAMASEWERAARDLHDMIHGEA